MELTEGTTADRVALAPWQTAVQPIPPDSVAKMDIQMKNLEGKHWVFHIVLNHCLKDDSQL